MACVFICFFYTFLFPSRNDCMSGLLMFMYCILCLSCVVLSTIFCHFLCFECELFLQLPLYRRIRNAALSCLKLTDSTNVLLPFSVFTRRYKAQTKPLSHLMLMFPLRWCLCACALFGLGSYLYSKWMWFRCYTCFFSSFSHIQIQSHKI